jgi:hypothetical protein
MLQSVTQWKTKAASRSSITTGVLDARFVSTLRVAISTALLECLQHSSGEITYGVRQSGIYRPRTQVVDRVGEQLGNVVHAFEWASDILEDAGRACRTLRLATTFA